MGEASAILATAKRNYSIGRNYAIGRQASILMIVGELKVGLKQGSSITALKNVGNGGAPVTFPFRSTVRN